MRRPILAIVLFAFIAFAPHQALAQSDNAPAEEFIQRVRNGLDDFIMVLPESIAGAGDWNVSVSITVQGRSIFERSLEMTAVEAPWTIPVVDVLRARSYRFDIGQRVREAINETDAALKDSVRRYGKGSGMLELNILPPEGLLADAREAVCSSNKPIYFDLFFTADVPDHLVRVEFADPLRDFFGALLKSSCTPSAPKPDPDDA